MLPKVLILTRENDVAFEVWTAKPWLVAVDIGFSAC